MPRRRSSITAIMFGAILSVLLDNGSASAGTLSIQSVMLNALGSKHGYAEYVVTIADSSPSPPPMTSIEIDVLANPPESGASQVEVLKIPSAQVQQIEASMRFALFLPSPDVNTVSVHCSRIGAGGAVITDDAQMQVTKTDPTPLRFDDSASWIGNMPSVFAFAAAQSPSPQPTPKIGGEPMGGVTVRAYIDARGSVVDAEVVSWSGTVPIDVAVDTARKSTFSPALLLTPSGTEATPISALIVYNFVNDRP